MNSKSLRQISSLSISTIGSRVLGLVRDATFFSYFGTSLAGSAFIIAFTIPNLFRRLLGEGALSSAFLPQFTKSWQTAPQSGFQLLNQTLTRLVLYFGGSTSVAILLLLTFHQFYPVSEKWEFTLPLLSLLLPYALLICIAAIITAALNAIGKFFLASLSPILLNLCMISALLIGGKLYQPESEALAYTLAAGVLIGGILQMLLPLLQTIKNGWTPSPDQSTSSELNTVKKLFLTATGGAAILQINVIITRLIAYQHSDAAVSQLYLASRLTELPLGVFAVSIYTVLFPLLSKYASAKEDKAFGDTCVRGISMTLAITLPAALGLTLLAKPILSLLFEWGQFSSSEVSSTAPILAIYSLSIPFYALISFLTRVFHSQQEMKTPVKVSGIALLINIVLSVSLMLFFDVKGLAAATVLTAICQFSLLSIRLRQQKWMQQSQKLAGNIIKIMFASLLMVSTIWLTLHLLPFSDESNRLQLSLRLFAHLVAGVSSYAAFAYLLGLHSSLKRD